MMRMQPSVGALTGLEAALAALLDGVEPVAPTLLPLDQTLGKIGAAMPPLAHALPIHDTAKTDGWACRALDLAGASAYSPLPLMAIPVWIEAGGAMPEGCDCVLDADLIDCSPMPQALEEAAPGQGVRRAGEDMEAGRPLIIAGDRLSAADLLTVRSAGIGEIAVRAPQVRLIDVAAPTSETFTGHLIADLARASGATVLDIETVSRDAKSVAQAIGNAAGDLIILIGGTGAGRADATADALAARRALIAHNVALLPGRTAAIGRLGAVPIIALPGAPDQAFGAFLALVQPAIDRLSGRSARRQTVLALERKISSTVGLAEIVLLKQEQDKWRPLAIGDFSMEAIRLADAWLAIPGGSEGWAAGTPVGAFVFDDPR
ncbi:MAG: molybdopterin-binding protein [Mesorhizobium sp.]|nr:molybdopterin-binding protein [Mesorhizobium sp.]RWI23985.1 MAG: molybdopterin-binding protein [Mesorhizobium sp.]RWK51492.1 MAG: molybdopterin-binding protein [Mesorhizobium sp.]RWK96198.1 MAG: molybdopterin-binding protein [Mesorhizobium sp.]TIQ32627.1 MAG: molybdopterin-binding protein [Mesorhizobium sp.]